MHLFSGWMPDSPMAHLTGDESVVGSNSVVSIIYKFY